MSIRLPKEFQVGPFEYTTIQRLRAEGLPDTISDDDALEKIRDAGDVITAVTGQIFWPVETIIRVDGRADALVYLPNYIPFIRVDEMYFVTDKEADELELVQPELYHVKFRYIESVSSQVAHWRSTITELRMWRIQRGRPFLFPAVPNGIEIRGVFGWVDRQRDVELELSADAVSGDELITVLDVKDVEPWDILLFPDGTHRIVTSVDVTGLQIHFEKRPIRADYATGTKLKVYGAIPRLLIKAANLIVFQNVMGVGTGCYFNDRINNRIKSETTDNYSYSISGSGWDGSMSLTGSEEADIILSNFLGPPSLVSV